MKAALAAAALIASSTAFAQYGGPTMQQVAGTWSLVSVVNTQPDGSRTEVFGPDPKGQVILTPDGKFSVMFARANLPKFAAGDRQMGTDDENKAVVRGSLAYVGTYTLDEGDQSLVMTVSASTFPAWVGQVQRRKVTVVGDRLEWVGVVGTSGGRVIVTLKRSN